MMVTHYQNTSYNDMVTIIYTAKLCYNGCSVNTDFFLVPGESLLISMSDNTVRMDSVSMEFRLL